MRTQNWIEMSESRDINIVLRLFWLWVSDHYSVNIFVVSIIGTINTHNNLHFISENINEL